MWTWFDGDLLRRDDIGVSTLAHGLHYGTGVLEGIRAYSDGHTANVFRLGDHVDRLFASASMIGMRVPFTAAEIAEAVIAVLRANNLHDAYVRPLVFYGEGAKGLPVRESSPVHVMVAAWPWQRYFEDGDGGLRVRISPVKRLSTWCRPTKAKASGLYLLAHLASREAIDNGYQEAILLDQYGNLAEAAAANLFVVRNGVISTPPTHFALEGITRDTVIALARDLGHEVRIEPLTPDDLFHCNEAFLTGTACEIAGIASVDGKTLGGASRSTVTRLAEAYGRLVRNRLPPGSAERYDRWLTPIQDSLAKVG